MKDLLGLEKEITKNIELKENYEFIRLEFGFIHFNSKKEESFYIIVYDNENDMDLYIGITPSVQTSIQSHIFRQHGVLNGEKIIDTINNHFGINIKCK